MKLSIIIPVYNVEKYLNRCMQTIIKQNNLFELLEIILVDDGSSDNSSKICDQYKKYSEVKVIHKENGGVSSARNRGLDEAKGDYVLFVDADDYLLEESLKIIMDTVDKYSADYYLFPVNKEIKPGAFAFQRYVNEGHILYKDFYSPFYFEGNNGPWSKVFKRSIISENKLTFNSELKIHEDVMFCMTYLEKCSSVYYGDNPIYCYAYNDNGAIRNHKIEYLSNYDYVYHKWKQFLDRHEIEVGDELDSTYLRKILTTCGKLYKNGVQKNVIAQALMDTSIYYELKKKRFKSFLEIVERYLLIHKMFYLVSLKVK